MKKCEAWAGQGSSQSRNRRTSQPAYSSFAIPKITGSCPHWRAFFRQGTKILAGPGTIIPADEQDGPFVFYVEEGEVHIVFNAADGRQRVVVAFGPGSIFNLAPAALMRDASGQYKANVKSLVWRMPATQLLAPEVLAASPEFAMSLIRQLSRLVLTYSTQLTDMQVSSFLHRFCRWLVSLQLKHEGSTTFPLGMSQEQLAAFFGVHRATLARAIQRLKQEGILGQCRVSKVEILNEEELKELAGL